LSDRGVDAELVVETGEAYRAAEGVFGGEVAGVVALGLASIGVEAEGDVCEGGDDVARCEDQEECGYGGEYGLHGHLKWTRRVSWMAITGADMRASRR
jgi:hypothetical protein